MEFSIAKSGFRLAKRSATKLHLVRLILRAEIRFLTGEGKGWWVCSPEIQNF